MFSPIMAGQPTPPITYPPEKQGFNKALLRETGKPIDFHKPFTRPAISGAIRWRGMEKTHDWEAVTGHPLSAMLSLDLHVRCLEKVTNIFSKTVVKNGDLLW